MSEATDVFEILMRENADMLLAFLRASVRDSYAVDDIFQETMIVAWRRLADFDRSRSFGKWIRGIAGKLVLAHFRKVGRNPISLDQSTLEWMETRFDLLQSQPGDSLSEKLELLRECVAVLSDENRATIEARYLHQNSLDEVVTHMGVALETVKKRLYRAKQQLEQCRRSSHAARHQQGRWTSGVRSAGKIGSAFSAARQKSRSKTRSSRARRDSKILAQSFQAGIQKTRRRIN